MPRGRNSNFLLVRYEDMKRDAVGELRRIAGFLGMAPSPDQLKKTVAANSADRMRELEKSQSQQWVATKGKRNDIPFIRQARAVSISVIDGGGSNSFHEPASAFPGIDA